MAQGTIEKFTNNASTKLAVDLADGSDTLVVVESGAFAGIYDTRTTQRATITNKAFPDELEIVRITATDGQNFTVQRGVEDTISRDWPAGSTIEARITAAQLGRFLQVDSEGIVRKGSADGIDNSFIFNGRGEVIQDAIQLSGIQLLQAYSASDIRGSGGKFNQDLNMSVESVGGTPFVQLGTVPVYTKDAHRYNFDMVAPATPNGFHYLLDISNHWSGTEYIGNAPTDFTATGYSFDAVDRYGEIVGKWVPFPTPLNFTIQRPVQVSNMVISEVGFICDTYSATTAPAVTISAVGNFGQTTVKLVDNAPLSNIQAANHVHRFPISFGGDVGDLRFQLNTPATGGFSGRFYWRGFFFSTKRS